MSTTTAPVARPPWLRLNWYSVLVVVLFVGCTAVLSYVSKSPMEFGILLGTAVMGLLLSFALGAGVGLAVRRSRLAFNVVFSLLLLTQFGALARAVDRGRERVPAANTAAAEARVDAALRVLQAQQRKAESEALAEMERTGDFTMSAEDAQRRAEQFMEAARELQGEPAVVFQTAFAFGKELNAAADEFQRRTEEFLASEGLSWDGLDEPDAVSRRLAATRLFREHSIGFRDRFDGVEQELRTRLTAAGVGGKALDQAVAGTRKGMKLEIVQRIRHSDVEALDGAIAALEVLDRSPRAWRLEDGEIRFDDDAERVAYVEATKRYREAIEQQTRAQKQFLGGS